jgi:orotate phosphoribosyltransferase
LSLLNVSAKDENQPMKQEHVLQTLREIGAIQQGHFQLSSGLHSDTYIQCARVFQDPVVAEQLCQLLCRPWERQQIDVVAGPALGGIIMAYEVARQLTAQAIFLEREQGHLTLRRGFQVKPGTRILVVEDVITTGGSVNDVIGKLTEHQAQILGVACVVDRSAGKAKLPVRLQSLVRISPPVYQPAECPLCQQKIPVQKPGSRK